VYSLSDIKIDVLKILIVDDEPDICYFLSNSLTKKGFLASCSHTLKGAEELIETSEPSVLVLDNHLPDGKGVEFAGKISSTHPELKIIMITAHDSPQDRAKAYNNGVSLFLSKPFTIGEIVKAVDLVTHN
jgi:DNA-binding response OmpR family regulator